MIKLKGGDDKNSIMNQAARRMGLPTANGAKSSQSFTSPGSHHSQQMQTQTGSAIPSGPTPVAQRLGMPSAGKSMLEGDKKSDKDWSAKSNRINLGGPVYIQGKTNRQDDEEEQTDDKVKRKIGDVTQHSDDDDDSEDEQENDEESRVMASLRAQRLAELKKSANKQQEWIALGHGEYSNIEQDSFLKAVTASKYVICHFYHNSFERCRIVDKHLEILTAAHLPTRFIKIDAEKAKFFVGKLQIRVLPTIVCFKDGIAIDRLVGFEDLGGDDTFETSDIERRLAKSGCLLSKDASGNTNNNVQEKINSIRSGQLSRMMDEDLDDIDDD